MGLVVLVALFGAVCTSGHFIAAKSLFLDNRDHYSFYYDNLHSLNEFGEPAYWAPYVQHGYPLFYLSTLGQTKVTSPTFVVLGAALWLLGRLGVHIRSFHTLVVLYTGFLFPMMFSLGVYALGRQVFRSKAAVLYVVIVGAFSPAVLLNIGDPGTLDLAAYWLFLAAASVAYLRRPGEASHRALSLALFALMSSLSVIWPNLLPLFAIFILAVVAPSVGWRRIRRALGAVPAWRWLATLAVAAAFALPSLLALRSSARFARARLDSLRYDFAQLKPGNPLEPAAASVPGVGFHWDRYWPNAEGPVRQYLPRPLLHGHVVAYAYLGLLAVPMAAFALLYGRAWLRLRLLLLLLLSFLVVLLSAYSPLFAAVLLLDTPFRSYNHFGDLFYRGGGFLALLFAAGAGLETFLTRKGVRRKPAVWIWAASVLVSGGAYLYFHADDPDRLGTLFGLLLLLALVFSALLLWLSNATAMGLRRRLVALLLFTSLVDVSTFAFWHVRTLTWVLKPQDWDRQRPDGVGLVSEIATGEAAEAISLKTMRDLVSADLPLDSVPPVALYAHAHVAGPIERHDLQLAITPSARRSLALSPEHASEATLARFLSSEGTAEAEVPEPPHLETTQRTYNELTIRVETAEEALLFVRDAHFPPYWRAWVDGAETPVYAALGAFKAVVVPAGQSTVQLRFVPRDIVAALWTAYALFALWAILAMGGSAARAGRSA